jgi:hypothetical protein
MKPTMTILVCVLAGGLASAQSLSVIQNTRNTMNAVSNNATAASNQALGIKQPAAHQATPAGVGASHAAAKSSGVAVAPVKSSPSASQTGANSAGAKTTGGEKRLPAVAARHHAQPKPAVVVPKNPAGAATLAGNSPAGSGEGENGSEQQVSPESKYNANGRRDPFISPVVSHAGGPGCSTGKKCLEIGTISLRGVVHGESGFIAVVSNSLNKAYFLRENDPVFNGYVVRITGDSIVFQETLQDRLGKTFTREVVKKITAPAV